MNLQNFNLVEWIQVMLVLVIAITLHEFAHALAADRLGDPLPRAQGRVSVNPADHLDPMGTVLMAVSAAVGFGIGWGRPVQFNPNALKSPRWGSMIVALCGPLSNILQALVFAAVLRVNTAHNFLPSEGYGFHLLTLGVLINLSLAFFNLLPVAPLDGFRILSSLLPHGISRSYERIMAQYGVFVFLALVFTGVAGRIIGPPVFVLYQLMVR